MAAVRNVLVVGAGIAGQTLACALARQGIACEVIELRPAFDIVGAGMYMQSTALRAFDEIGLADAVTAAGWPIWDDHTIVATAAGEELVRTRHRRIAGPSRPIMVPIRRRTLHDVLARAVGESGVRVRMGVTVEGLEARGEEIAAQLSDGSTQRFDLVVGADGIRSKVRSLVFPGVEPVFTGFANWRAILPRPAALTVPTWLMGADGKSFGMIPLSAEALYIAGVSKEPGNPRFERDALPALLRERFAHFGGMAPALIAQVTRGEQVVYTPIEEVALPRPWYHGRVVVLGDAAHASTPFWAQGAAMAIEDSVLLARLLGTGASLEATLAEWVERRYGRCMFVQKGAAATGAGHHADDPGGEAARYAEIRARAQGELDRRLERLGEPI